MCKTQCKRIFLLLKPHWANNMRNILHRYPIHPKYSFPRDEQLMTHLMMAYLAIKCVKKLVTHGAANRPDSTPEAFFRVLLSVAWMEEQKKKIENDANKATEERVLLARATTVFRAGNCEAQATCAFGYLFRDLKVSNMEIVRLKQDHCFLVIGRDPQSDIADYSTWGKNTVVCDPWASRYFPATDLRYQLNDIFMEAKFPTIDASDPLTCRKLYSYGDISKSMTINMAQASLTYRELHKIYNQQAAFLALTDRKITMPFHSPYFLKNHSNSIANIGFFKSNFKYSPPVEKQNNPWKVRRSWF